ncbi:HEAT repeat-containing protein 4 [Elgaria multicarinata webbii]|uniref:HEAT repeat-containing protein 4 n=1 Tax=Elgaria multicarinata webbii TaxID=159646 RepID=UPI002FCD17A3
MEVPAFFKSKDLFPLESSLKVKLDRKNWPSHHAVVSAVRAKMPLIYQRDVSHTKWHYACYQKECLKNVAQDLHFAKDVIKQRVPSAQSYKEYDPTRLYDFYSLIQTQESEHIISKKWPKKLRPLRRLSPTMKLNVTPAKQVITANVPFSLEEDIWKAKAESILAEADLLVPIPPPPPPPCEFLYPQAFLTEPHEMLGDTMKKKWSTPTIIQSTTAPELERKNLEWEEKLLTKLSKTTAQWIVNNQPSWGGWIQGKPRGFKRQKYDWNSIRYVLPIESDVDLLDEIQAEDEVVEGRIQRQEVKKLEIPLTTYYRTPSFHTRMLTLDDPTSSNETADKISEKSLKPVSPIKHHERLSSRVGKYSYTTQNVFEQELYFGSANIVHQDSKKDRLVMDNHDEYYKHLEQRYPRPPELWSFKPAKKTVQRVQKGAIHWTALPTLVEDFAKFGEAQSPVSSGRKREPRRRLEEDVPEEICIRRNMLEQWKAAWKFDPRWQSATIEGLMRDPVDVHVQNRINAILICASAVLERTQAFHDPSQETVIGIESVAKGFKVEDVPKKIQPLLKNTLFDKDAHVRMAAAVCFYVIGECNEKAQAIMRNALINGNTADSWTAAQALALDGITSFPVVKRILSQIFDDKDDATEDQACLLLSRLSKHTGLVHCLLASELNSYQWNRRVLACKTLSRIRGSVSQDLKNKIVQLMWADWKFDVRQAAAKALGHLELGKEVHDQLREGLKRGNYRMRVEALSLIGWLKFMTARLLPGFLRCFSDDFVAVRKEACWTAAILKIKEEMVLKCLFKMMQTDPLWKIKALAIRALGQIGEASPYLKELLLWALHYEEDPGVRREACRSIITLKMQDETVRATLLERMILEPNELVKEEVSRAVTTFNFEQEEEQEMIQKIKDKIATLSQKDLVIEKLLKLQEITENTWHEAHRIYREKGDVFAYREIRDIFFAVIQATFTEQTSCPSRKFSKLWTAILNLLPWLGIPSNPWTQKAFLEALEIHNAEKQKCAKKPKTPTEKQKEPRVIKKNEDTTATVHFVP